MRSPTTPADLDDGYYAGLVTIEAAAAQSVAKFRELDEAAEMQFPGAPNACGCMRWSAGLIDWLVSGLIEGTVAAAAGLRMSRRCARTKATPGPFSPSNRGRQPRIEAISARQGVRIRAAGRRRRRTIDGR